MTQFALMLRDDADKYADISPEEMQQIIGRYSAWADKMKELGKLAGGQKLIDGDGRVVRGNNGAMNVVDGPFAETKEILGGYFILEATDCDEILELIGDCPHLDFGPIEVRQIHEMD